MPKSIIADSEVNNTQLFYDQLDRLMGASIGVIAVRTRETNRAQRLLHQWASMTGLDFNVWDVLTGFHPYLTLPIGTDKGTQEPALDTEDMVRYLTPQPVIDGTGDVLSAMTYYKTRETDKSLTRSRFCGVFMGVVEDWLKEPMVQQHIRDHVLRSYTYDDRMILMLTPGTIIPEAIAGDIEVIDLHPPSFSELLDSFAELETDIPESFNYAPNNEDRASIVQNGLGMTDQEFQNAVSLAIVDTTALIDKGGDVNVSAKTFVKVIRGRKLEMLKQTKVLELMPDISMDTVAGLDLLKADLDIQKDSFTAAAAAFGIDKPQGFVVVGPPGTGKTLVAQATASIFGIPGIRFDVASVYGSLLGQSESKMKSTLQMLEDMAPCVAFIDELEKAIGGGGQQDGGGTGSRVFGQLISWMQDKKNRGVPVYMVAAANNIAGMPPEMLRKGRFDDIWGVSFPSDVERAATFKIHVEKRGHELTKQNYMELAKASTSFVGGEIEDVVIKALRLDFRAGAAGIQMKTVLARIDATIPQSKAFPERVQEMADWCKANARNASSVASFDLAPLALPKVGRPNLLRPPLKAAPRSSSN